MANNQPDVRVRLSAEGVQEVVNALKQVQQQARNSQTAVAGTSSSMSAMASELAGLRARMDAFAASAAVVKGLGLAQHLVESADATGLLSQKMGLSVESVSRMQYAFSSAGLAFDEMQDALKEFAIRSSEAVAATGEGYAAFKAMGIEVLDSNGKMRNQSDLLEEVADKMQSYAAGMNKATLYEKLFGEVGLKLVPVLDQGADGLRRLYVESDKVGYTMNEKSAKAARQLRVDLARVSAVATALGRELGGPVLSYLAKFAETVESAFNRYTKALDGGLSVTQALKSALSLQGYRTDLSQAEADVASLTKKYADSVQFARDNPLLGSVFGSQNVIAEALKKAQDNVAELKKTNKMLAAPPAAPAPQGKSKPGLPPPPPPLGQRPNLQIPAPTGDLPPMPPVPKPAPGSSKPKSKPAPGSVEAPNAEMFERNLDGDNARVAKLAAIAQAEVALIQARNEKIKADDDKALQAGLLSLTEYYDKRRAAIEQQNTAEIEAAKKALEAAKATRTQTPAEAEQRLQAIATAQQALDAARVSAATKLAQFDKERLDAEIAGTQAVLELEKNIAEQKGQYQSAAEKGLDLELQKTEQLLKMQGVAADKRKALLDELRKVGTANINYDDKSRQADAAKAKLDADKAAIQSQADAGSIFQFQAQMRIRELEASRLPMLRDMADELMRAAKATGDIEKIQAASEYAQYVQTITTEASQLASQFKELRDTFEDSAKNGLANALNSLADGTSNVRDAFQNMAFSIVQSLSQVLAKMIAVKAMESAMGAFGFAGGGQVGSFIGRFATGGYISGPGTGTSDSIPAYLSNGEFVVRSAVVRQPGVLSMLSDLNRGQLKPQVSGFNPAGISRFADGGIVGSVAEAAGGNTSLQIGLSDGLVLEKLQSKAGQRVIVETIGKHRRAINQRL